MITIKCNLKKFEDYQETTGFSLEVIYNNSSCAMQTEMRNRFFGGGGD
jgi:hypothetical protein